MVFGIPLYLIQKRYLREAEDIPFVGRYRQRDDWKDNGPTKEPRGRIEPTHRMIGAGFSPPNPKHQPINSHPQFSLSRLQEMSAGQMAGGIIFPGNRNIHDREKMDSPQPPLPSPPRGRSFLLLEPNLPWKVNKPINRPAPFLFGKGGGIGPNRQPDQSSHSGAALSLSKW
jgi:hypothetical protein